MRKLLLASAAMLGATSGLAFAQTTPVVGHPNEGQLIAPRVGGPAANNNNNNWGTANTVSGDAAASPITRLYPPNTVAVPTPGTIVVRLNGRIEAGMSAIFTTGDKGLTGAGVGNGYKVNPIGVYSYARLYPGFDGLSANGIRYGASLEIRENFMGANTFTTTPPGGVASGSGNTSAQTLFVRRSFTYLATDQAGIIRIGVTDGVIGLFDPGIFTSQTWDAGIGNFNGGANQSLSPGAGVGVPFAWLSQAGAEYGNNKIVYLSPQFFGFDFGVQYAPNMGNMLQDSSTGSPLQATTCNSAGANCISLSSGADATRWLNQVAVGARYQGTFGGVDVKAYAVYETAGKENLTTTAYTAPTPTGTAITFRYDNLSFVSAGAAVSAMGLTAAVDYIGGALNGQLAMRPTGGAPEHAVVAGLTYVNGPFVLGAEVGLVNSQGDARLTGISQRREVEFAAGGTYNLAPGVALVGEYMYTQRHQNGYDFVAGNVVGNGGVTSTRDAKGNGFVVSTVLTW